MKVYTCDSFEGHWPVGTAAVVWASTPGEAAILLNAQLTSQGLPGKVEPAHMIEFHAGGNPVRVLCDGDY